MSHFKIAHNFGLLIDLIKIQEKNLRLEIEKQITKLLNIIFKNFF